MNRCCCIPLCSSTDCEIPFPTDLKLRDKWIEVIMRNHLSCRDKTWKPMTKAYVCQDHFVSEDFLTVSIGGTEVRTRKLKSGRIPSVKLECCAHRTRKVLTQASEEELHFEPLVDEHALVLPPRSADELVFETDDNYVVINTQLKFEVNTLTEEYENFKKALTVGFIDTKDIDSSSVQEMTGIASLYEFQRFLEKTKALMPDGMKSEKHESHAVLVLTKLKMDIPDTLLSLVHMVDASHVETIVLDWLEALSTWLQLHPIIKIEIPLPGFKRVFYASILTVTEQRPKLERESRSSWLRETCAEPDLVNHISLCIIDEVGRVAFVSSLYPPDTLAISILSESKEFSDLLTDADQIFVLSSEQVIQKKDIELGVALEIDDEQYRKHGNSPPLKKAEAIIHEANQFMILSSGFSEPYRNSISKVIKLCAVLPTLGHYLKSDTNLKPLQHLSRSTD